jgi:hypothetical protein
MQRHGDTILRSILNARGSGAVDKFMNPGPNFLGIGAATHALSDDTDTANARAAMRHYMGKTKPTQLGLFSRSRRRYSRRTLAWRQFPARRPTGLAGPIETSKRQPPLRCDCRLLLTAPCRHLSGSVGNHSRYQPVMQVSPAHK